MTKNHAKNHAKASENPFTKITITNAKITAESRKRFRVPPALFVRG